MQLLLYLILFQDTNTPSVYENSKWPFVKWSWDTVHLAQDAHEDRGYLDGFLGWLTQKTSGLSSQTVSKNQLQGLLLGTGLLIRDLELACFTDHGEIPVPDYLVDSCMAPSDTDSITQVLKAISNILHNNMEYVLPL